MAAAIDWICPSHEPAAMATGVQVVLNEYQSTAPCMTWHVVASAAGAAPAEVNTRRSPSGPRWPRSSRKPAQVLPLPTVSATDVVAPTSGDAGELAAAGA